MGSPGEKEGGAASARARRTRRLTRRRWLPPAVGCLCVVASCAVAATAFAGGRAAADTGFPIDGNLTANNGCAQAYLQVMSIAQAGDGFDVTWQGGWELWKRGAYDDVTTLQFQLTDEAGRLVGSETEQMTGTELLPAASGTVHLAPGTHTLRLTVSVSYTGTRCSSDASSVQFSTAGTATPLDGMIFRLSGRLASNGGGTVLGCPLTEMTTGARATATTVRPSKDGWTIGGTIPRVRSGSTADVMYGSDGTLLYPEGHTIVEKGASTLALDVNPSSLSCGSEKSASSPAGDVYPMTFATCDATCATSPVDPSLFPHGPGCVAVWIASSVLTLTVQIGPCTPESLPPVTASVSGGSAGSTTSRGSSPWRNCATVNKRYPHGIGRRGAHDKTRGKPVTNFKRSARLYTIAVRANGHLDGDKDGIACEKH